MMLSPRDFYAKYGFRQNEPIPKTGHFSATTSAPVATMPLFRRAHSSQISYNSIKPKP